MILVVDDDFDISSLIKVSLEKAGFSVSSFTDPVLALENFRPHQTEYDLVISDIRMPVMDGYEFVQQIKKIKPMSASTKLMSAFEFSELEGVSDSDIDGFLEKPITLRKLNDIVVKCMNNGLASKQERYVSANEDRQNRFYIS
jgi:CheY-like chemotaxis protein